MYKKKLIIIDAYNLLFRAFYALSRHSLTNQLGTPVGAVYGFINMIFKYIENPPEYIAIASDTGKKTFRELIYPEYKIQRGEVPEDLCIQFPLFKEAMEAFDLPLLSKEGYEADDLIATLVNNFSQDGLEIKIVSSDKDLIQLMSHNVTIIDPINNQAITEEYVMEKFGVPASCILDFLSLTGDASDNIPGIPGIGKVTAAKLINEFHTLENLLQNLESLKSSKIKENLINFQEKAIISKQLITLHNTVDLDINLESLKTKNLDASKIKPFLEKNGFKNTWSKIEPILKKSSLNPNVEISQVELNNSQIFVAYAKENGIISIEQNSDILLCTTYDCSKTIENQTEHYVTLKINCLNISADIKDLFDNESIIKIADVNHDFLHIHHINSLHMIKVMMHVLDSSNQHNNYKDIPLLKLYFIALGDLFKQQLFTVYFQMEKPIIEVIKSMEIKGVKIDANILQDFSAELDSEIKSIENEIFDIAGCSFNIASPKQLAELLFEKMAIPYPSKEKKHSTDAEVMESLVYNGYKIAEKILHWRSLSKLKNTYADSLVKHINPITNRVHTTYSSIGTNTGRFSSFNPNLQNIPRNNRIKRAFVAPANSYLLSADYSQIELRIIAHLANIAGFKQILSQDGDIHAFTASQIFHTDLPTKELRQKAKAINFGIIYGITPFGLAKQLGTTTAEAKEYIELYFKQYPEIKEYMENTKHFARNNGYVVTRFGRRCTINNINSSNFTLRNLAERSAINAPIQGTAADIIKKALIKIFQTELSKYIIMQVHDEVILEVPKEILNHAKTILCNLMEGIDQEINLKVSINFGNNLAENLINDHIEDGTSYN